MSHPAEPSDATESTPGTDSPEARVRTLLEEIRPYLQGDGGDVEFVAFEAGIVSLRLQGACTTCPSSILTLKMGIENALREQVPEVEQVVTVE